MKTIPLLIAGLMLCSCGENDSGQNKNTGNRDRPELLKELAQKKAETQAAVIEIKRRMQGMRPGGQSEIEATKLRDAQTRHDEAETAYRKKLEE